MFKDNFVPISVLTSRQRFPFIYLNQSINVICNWAFTRYDRRTDRSVRLVGPTQVRPTGLSDQSDRAVGQTVAEPPTSVNQINVAC